MKRHCPLSDGCKAGPAVNQVLCVNLHSHGNKKGELKQVGRCQNCCAKNLLQPNKSPYCVLGFSVCFPLGVGWVAKCGNVHVPPSASRGQQLLEQREAQREASE